MINNTTNGSNDQSHQPSAPPARPKVLIIGAGLGGLTLGMLLHKANISFDIFERASEVKNIGKYSLFQGTVHTAQLYLTLVPHCSLFYLIRLRDDADIDDRLPFPAVRDL